MVLPVALDLWLELNLRAYPPLLLMACMVISGLLPSVILMTAYAVLCSRLYAPPDTQPERGL